MLYEDNKDEARKADYPGVESGRYEKDPELGLALVGDDAMIDERDVL